MSYAPTSYCTVALEKKKKKKKSGWLARLGLHVVSLSQQSVQEGWFHKHVVSLPQQSVQEGCM